MITVVHQADGSTQSFNNGQQVGSTPASSGSNVAPTTSQSTNYSSGLSQYNVQSQNWSIGSNTPSGVYVPSTVTGGDPLYLPGATQQIGANGQTVINMPSTPHAPVNTNYVAPQSTVVPTNPFNAAPVVPGTDSNGLLPSTGGVGGMIDKVAPVFVLLILVKIISGAAGLFGHK